MSIRRRLLDVLIAVLAVCLGAPKPVLAYLDPGTGSYIFQLLIGAVVGLGFLIKMNWNRFKLLFTKKQADEPQDDAQ